MNNKKRAQISQVTVGIIIVMFLVFLGLVYFFIKAKDFNHLLGI